MGIGPYEGVLTMAELRPKRMTQGEFAELLRENGFPACSKTAISLAERSKETGVGFTAEARNVARGLLNSTRRTENRKNGAKTTIWFDEETRAWLEQRAYMEDSNVGEIVRRIVNEYRQATSSVSPGSADTFPSRGRLENGKAAPEMAVSEAAEDIAGDQ